MSTAKKTDVATATLTLKDKAGQVTTALDQSNSLSARSTEALYEMLAGLVGFVRMAVQSEYADDYRETCNDKNINQCQPRENFQRESDLTHERDQTIDNRSLFGHWEADLMQFRTQKGNLLTAVERKTGLTLASGLPSKYSATIWERSVRQSG